MKTTVQQWWAKRNQREQYVLLGGGVMVLIFLTLEWVIIPIVDRMNQLDFLMGEKEREVLQFEEFRHTYHGTRSRLQNIVAKLEKQEPGFSLVTVIEQMTMVQQLKQAMTELRPIVSAPKEGYQETAVELALEKISLRQTISFLQALESSPYYLQVKLFSMKSRFSDPSALDVRMVISSYESSSRRNNL